ncbi:hypothetical protein ACWGDE_10705 [Streptomyces sp. NPDC054956]
MVRALVAGVGVFDEAEVSEEDANDGYTGLDSLPSVGPAVREVASAFDRLGLFVGGDPMTECDKAEFLARWDRLRTHAAPGEALVVHFAGHGICSEGELFLGVSGADTREQMLDGTCVSVADLRKVAGRSGHPVLLVLDVCGAGQALVEQQLAELVARRPQDAARSVWFIGASAAGQAAFGAGLSTALAQVLQQLADGDLDLSPNVEFVPIETLAAVIDRRLVAIDASAGRPGRTVVRTTDPAATATEAPFFRNPAYRTGAAGVVAGIDPRLREFALSAAPGLDPLHFATRAAGRPDLAEIAFSGRASALKRIEDWLDASPAEQGPVLAVTGGPGSGKSALLGVTACLLHPDLESEPQLGQRIGNAVPGFEPRQPATVLAVHARQLSLAQITEALHAQLRRQYPACGRPGGRAGGPYQPDTARDRPEDAGVAGLLTALRGAGDVLVILDALDEAGDPAGTVTELLLPLAALADEPGRAADGNVRVLVGTRPWWDSLPALHGLLQEHPGAVLDLDPADEAERSVLAADLEGYLRKLLPRRHPARPRVPEFAARLAAYTDHGAFLVAGLYAEHLLATGGGGSPTPPCSITEVFDLHRATLAAADPWIDPVLAAVGRARGAGMPADLIHAVALAARPADPHRPTPTLADTRRVLGKAAFYLRTTPDSDHRLLYRYFHQALAEHTEAGTDPAAVHRVLTAAVPVSAEGTQAWAPAGPYLLRHAVVHAHEAGGDAVDQLLTNLEYVLHADPDSLAPYLHHAVAERAVLHADIYRSTVPFHPDRHVLGARRDLLALDALAWQQPGIAQDLIATEEGAKPFTPRWATRLTHTARRHTLTEHFGSLIALATGPDGIPLAVTAGKDRLVKVWDLLSGTARHTLTGHAHPVTAVAVASGGPDDSLLAVTADESGTVIAWDLEAGTTRHTLTGHIHPVTAAVSASASGNDGAPLAFTADDGGTVIVWNLDSGTMRHTWTAHRGALTALAVATGPDGIPLAVTAGKDRTVKVWDLLSGTARHTLTGHTSPVATVAMTSGRDGSPLAVTSDEGGTVRVWDLDAGTERHTMTGHTRPVRAIAVASGPDGTPLAVTADHQGRVIVWNLDSGTARHSLTGHTRPVRAVAVASGPGGTPLAVTVGDDRTAIVWDLESGTARHTLTGHTDWIFAVAVTPGPDGALLAVTTSQDHTAIVWDLVPGTARHTRTGHTHPVTAIASGPDGSELAVTVCHNGTALVWDLESGTARPSLRGLAGPMRAVAVASGGPDGSLLAVTISQHRPVTVWDLESGTPRRTLRGHTRQMNGVAVASGGPDGSPLAVTVGDDRTVIVWDLLSGTVRQTMTGHAHPISSVAITAGADGSLLAVTAGKDLTARVWDLVSGTERHTLTGHTQYVRAVAVTSGPDGAPLAITADDTATVIVWDLVSGTERHTLVGHTRPVRAVAVVSGPDGSPLAVTAGKDRNAIVWDLNTGEEVHRYHLPHGGSCVTATATGFVIAYGPEVAYFALRTDAPA